MCVDVAYPPYSLGYRSIQMQIRFFSCKQEAGTVRHFEKAWVTSLTIIVSSNRRGR